MLKKSIFLLFSVLTPLFYSCDLSSNEDVADEENEESLIPADNYNDAEDGMGLGGGEVDNNYLYRELTVQQLDQQIAASTAAYQKTRAVIDKLANDISFIKSTKSPTKEAQLNELHEKLERAEEAEKFHSQRIVDLQKEKRRRK